MSRLRQRFRDCPIAAFTASATRQVRHDIVDQLKLRDTDKYIASFHRPNLRYLVKACDAGAQKDLLLRALRRHSGSSAIVYSPTIRRVEETVEFLKEHGIAAIGYHGKMDSATRRAHQEKWMSDEVRVLVGTVAFGLGINKAAVLFGLPDADEFAAWLAQPPGADEANEFFERMATASPAG